MGGRQQFKAVVIERRPWCTKCLMKFILWNIRGMGSGVKKRFVSKLISNRNPDFILIQESKMEKVEKRMIHNLWKGAQIQFAISEAEGQSGGLISIWRADKFREESTMVSKHFIIVNGTYLGDFKCSIVNIHAPSDIGERKRLWDELLLLKSHFVDP